MNGAGESCAERLPCGAYLVQHRLEVISVIEARGLIPFCGQVCKQDMHSIFPLVPLVESWCRPALNVVLGPQVIFALPLLPTGVEEKLHEAAVMHKKRIKR